MWEQLFAATNTGTPITAILNPSSGPDVVNGDLGFYKTILNTYLNLGDERAEPSADDNDSLTVGKHPQTRDWGITCPKLLISFAVTCRTFKATA